MISIIKSFFKAFRSRKTSPSNKIQSFTFFIPSPPPRNTLYREKQFDKFFCHFINKGYKILNFKTEVSYGNGGKQSGMWAIFIVEATHNNDNKEINFDEDLPEDSKGLVEGLYYINDQENN